MANPFPFVSGSILEAAQLNGIGEAWTSYTPSWTNITIGNGTVSAKYGRVNKIIIVRATFTLGSTSAVTNYGIISLPITAAVDKSYGGGVNYFDTSANYTVPGYFDQSSSTTGVTFGSLKADQTFVYGAGLSATAPFTWATGDAMFFNFWYEAA